MARFAVPGWMSGSALLVSAMVVGAAVPYAYGKFDGVAFADCGQACDAEDPDDCPSACTCNDPDGECIEKALN